MLKLEGIEKRHTGAQGAASFALRELTLTIPSGSIVALVGPSGSGKTTALRLMNGLEQPTSGSVWLEGQRLSDIDLVAHRRRTGYVIQDVGLLPHWNIADNITTVPRLLGEQDPTALRALAETLALQVELEPALLPRRPHELSGGQKSRVGIARALAAKPTLLLMDEPFGALDPLTRLALRRLILRIKRERHLTCVLVTHDLDDARALADQIAVLRDGKLAELLSREQLLNQTARDPWVREFFGQGDTKPDAGTLP